MASSGEPWRSEAILVGTSCALARLDLTLSPRDQLLYFGLVTVPVLSGAPGCGVGVYRVAMAWEHRGVPGGGR